MAIESANNKRIAKNTILLSIRMIFVLGIALYVSRITLQNLGVEDFGIYNVVCGFVLMFAFLNNAMSTGIQRFYNFEYGKNGTEGANKVYITALFSQALLSIIIICLLESVGIWYLYKKMVIPENRLYAASWIFQMSVISTVIMMLQVPYNAAILAHERMDFYAFLSVLNQILKLCAVLALPYLSGDYLIIYGFMFLCITVLDFFLNVLYAKHYFPEIYIEKRFYSKLFREIMSFSGWNLFGKFAIMMKDQGLNMVLNLFFGPVINAARGLAFQVTSALNGFVSNINVAVKPQLTQSYAQGNLHRTFSLMFSASKLCFFVLFLISLPVCLDIDFLLEFWLGIGKVPAYTNIFIILVMIMSFVSTLNAQISFIVHATGVMKKYQVITGIISLLIVPISYIYLCYYPNPAFVFVIALLVDIINLYVSILILKGIVEISVSGYIKDVILSLFIMSIVAFIVPFFVWYNLSQGWTRLIIVSSLSFISSILSFYFLGLNKREKKIAISYLRIKFK